MTIQNVTVPDEQIEAFCHRWKITELSLFGSGLRDDFSAESDLDLLVDFAADARWSLLDLAQMELDLEDLFGRKVDLVTREAVVQSHNWIRRHAILTSARVLYAAEHV